MAQELRSQGHQVALLVLLDSLPFAEEGDRTVDEKKLFASFIEDLAAVSRASAMEEPLVLKEELDLELEQLKKANIVPQDIDLPQFDQIWQQYRAIFGAFIRYEPRKYTGKITLMMAPDRHAGEQPSPMKSWAPLAGGGLSIDVLPGDHYALLRHPVVQLTAEKLGAVLESSRFDGETTKAP